MIDTDKSASNNNIKRTKIKASLNRSTLILNNKTFDNRNTNHLKKNSSFFDFFFIA